MVRPALEMSLKKLQMDYVDLFIIHIPAAMKVSFSFSVVSLMGLVHKYFALCYVSLIFR